MRPLFEKRLVSAQGVDKLVLVGPNGCGKTPCSRFFSAGIEFDGDVLISSPRNAAIWDSSYRLEMKSGSDRRTLFAF
jgi:ATPase subunit of ABC transporter with duplicated ATPase domains